MMRIVFFRHSLLSRGGDKMIALHASHLATAGHEVIIRCNIVDTVFRLDPRVKIEKLSLPGKFGTVMSAIAWKDDADAIIADIIPLATLLCTRNRRKLVYYAQDYDESYYFSSAMKRLIRILYGFSLRTMRLPVVAVSHPLAALLRKTFSADAVVVENGIDCGVFYPDPDLDLIAGKEKRKALLVLSRNDRRKGFDLAKKVLGCSATSSDLLEVWTVGERCEGAFGPLRHRHFGYANEARLRKIMSSADLFFYPTRHEGFPLMPLEANACGCPVLTTTAVPYATGEPSMVATGIEDVEAMLRALTTFVEDEKALDHLKIQATRFTPNYRVEVCLHRFEQALASIARVS